MSEEGAGVVRSGRCARQPVETEMLVKKVSLRKWIVAANKFYKM